MIRRRLLAMAAASVVALASFAAWAARDPSHVLLPTLLDASGPAALLGAPADPPPSPQEWAEKQSAQCLAAIQSAERKYQTPPGLLATIAKVESGRPVPPRGEIQPWPWAIDADGAALFLDSKAAAVAWVRQGLGRGLRLVDVGCMQVNLQMHPTAFRSLEEAFDPVLNADYAARFLKQLKESEAGGSWEVAVGFYHSHTPILAASYRDRVAEVGRGILTGVMGEHSLYMRAVRQGTLRLALAGGGVMVINVNRQPSARPHRRMSACQVARVLGDYLSAPPRAKECGRVGR